MSDCCNNSDYGRYRTRTFVNIWSNVTLFKADIHSAGFTIPMTEDNMTTLYYLLYAMYGNSHIANSDENQFKYKVYSIMYMFGPAWEKRLDIQSKLRNLTDNELLLGSKQINNHSFNPSTQPSTSTLEELETINEQTTTQFKKGKLDGYAFLWDLISTDVTTELLNRFKPLFLQLTAPQESLYYVYNKEEDDL